MIDQLEKLLRAKQAQERELAFSLEKGSAQRNSHEESKGPLKEPLKGPTKMQKQKQPVSSDAKKVEDGPIGVEYEGGPKETYGSKSASGDPRKLEKKTYELRDFDEGDQYDFKLMDALEET